MTRREPLLLDDLARLLGLERSDLDRELAGLGAKLGVRDKGPYARFQSESNLMTFLVLRATLEGRDSGADALQDALGALAEAEDRVRQAELDRVGMEVELRELRRILHGVVKDNAELTQRVNELSLLRMRQKRSGDMPAPRPWYLRLLDRLLGRRDAPGDSRDVRRVA